MRRIGLVAVLVVVGMGSVVQAVEWGRCLSQKGEWYEGEEAVRIAGNVLLYQRSGGGWPKNTEMADRLSDDDKKRLVRDKGADDSTIDNGATCKQIRYLAKVYGATENPWYEDAFLRGMDYLLEAQYDNGGWPQFYPRTRGYYANITFNDNAMVNVMTLLGEIRDEKGEFAFVDEGRRKAAARAISKGIECILKCQIVVDGRKLGWCAQHDPKTFKAAPARSYEKASLSGSEGAGVTRYLMSIEKPSKEIVSAIEAAVVWFDEVKIMGLRETREKAPGTEKGYDKVMVADDKAGPIWGRFYQIGTNRAIFCSRDGVIRYKVSEISYERRNGYSWYTSGPARLLKEDYPRWRKKYTPGRDVLGKQDG